MKDGQRYKVRTKHYGQGIKYGLRSKSRTADYTSYDCLKNRLYCFISHYLLWNYVTKYSFIEFIQTSPQIVDFECFPIYGIYGAKLLNQSN